MGIPVSLVCGRCGASFDVPLEMAGRTGACQNCGTQVRVPPRAVPIDDDSTEAVSHAEIGYYPEPVASNRIWLWFAAGGGALILVLAIGLIVAMRQSSPQPVAEADALPAKKHSFGMSDAERQALWPGSANQDPATAPVVERAEKTVVDLSRAQNVFKNVEEARDYTLVYHLPLPDLGRFNFDGVPYAVDNRPEIHQPFDRVAYYLELQEAGGELKYAYASFDAMTDDLPQLAVPTRPSKVQWQMQVQHLHVVSNVPEVTAAQDGTGTIELWGTNYGPGNGANFPGADPDTFDFGDQVSNGGDYGSLQVHNLDAKQTVLAYNQWGSGNGEAGIGNQPGKNPDWTFSSNITRYVVRNLSILVRLRPAGQ